MRKRIAMVLLALGVPGAATAQTITFDALGGANGSFFSSYSESGFDVALTSGTICVAKNFGNPIPDLFGGPACSTAETSSTLRITRSGGGAFQFVGADFATQNGTSSYTFQGFLASLSQYSGGGTLPGNGAFATYASGNSGTGIDELFISFAADGGASSYNVDNIVLASTAVPEPSTVALLAAGLLGMGAVRSRRRRA